MGRLDRSAVPPLVAVLDSPDPALAADAATVLGMIGDKEAVPFLTFPAASPSCAAGRAHRRPSGDRPADADNRSPPSRAHPVQVLTDAAWSYHRHQVEFPDDPVVVWAWDKDRKVPAPREVPRTEAEAILGLRFAREALRLDPNDRDAQVAQLSLALEKAIERVGFCISSRPRTRPPSPRRPPVGRPSWARCSRLPSPTARPTWPPWLPRRWRR